MKIYTIGFTKTTAENFFERIKSSRTRKIIDVRLNNVSQLSGFAKRDDLKYFSSTICGVGYQHTPEFAPTKEILDSYKKHKGPWEEYEEKFLDLMAKRKIEEFDNKDLDGACLLCSEAKHHYCHRRLVAEYLQDKWSNIEIIHL